MKKKSIKHLTLGKKTVSKLNKNEVTGGLPATVWICPTPPVSLDCPTPPVTGWYCTI